MINRIPDLLNTFESSFEIYGEPEEVGIWTCKEGPIRRCKKKEGLKPTRAIVVEDSGYWHTENKENKIFVRSFCKV